MTMTGLVLRAVGMLFRVYIAGKIGAQGMGVYQLITTAYTMAVTLGTAGLTLAATRICADLLAEGCEGEVKYALHKVILLGAATGCLTAAALFFQCRLGCCALAHRTACGAVAENFSAQPSLYGVFFVSARLLYGKAQCRAALAGAAGRTSR